MKELIEMSDSKIKWCDGFLKKCIKVLIKTNPIDSDGYPTIEQLNNLLTREAGFNNIDLELVYMLRKLDFMKKNYTN